MTVPLSTKKVAVIGAGASGLVAARELMKEGHDVVVFDRGAQLGGNWVYLDEVESDPLGLDPTRKIIDSSLYASLRTNTPREAMGFRDFPFAPTGKVDRDSRRFPGHHEVRRYLEDFASEFGLNELISFRTEVRHVGLETDGKWMVKYASVGGDESTEVAQTYDAVVVCTGHFTEPQVADNIPGLDLWPGRQIHSHNYRIPEPYQDKVVVVIGLSSSATDISREIARSAKEVHVTTRSKAAGKLGKFGKHDIFHNLWLHPMIERAHEDGKVSFQDGSTVFADIILHCTGYKQHFPFLDTNGVVSVDDNRVGPLYKHVFPPSLAPGISFIGVPSLILSFFVYELQSKWVAGVLSGRISLPSEEKMMEDVEAFYSKLDAKGVPKRYTHKIHDVKQLSWSLEYEDWLAAQCGCPLAEEWRKAIFLGRLVHAHKEPETYRDEWDDDDLVLQAYEDFMQYLNAEGRAALAACASTPRV
ncbi:flavin-containing monooxygenase FMO GS-OX-like 5 isoform X1 [Chenopodium quinoa]|uniref:Flavin-containing monooxygenase n=1 Tax=Chenopodium quinoa TaxID=63459 RepID=A0A803LMA4_CHEQI|nr:flavin-containing monooxygenase FMO GS-OX-like 5 isoform X1 [Chenopodium quinoa]